jgi:hypothetical protein
MEITTLKVVIAVYVRHTFFTSAQDCFPVYWNAELSPQRYYEVFVVFSEDCIMAGG